MTLRAKNILIASIGFALTLASGCASAEKVPSIDSEGLPKLQLSGLNPRSLRLVVKVSRAANKQAGNTAEVEKAVASSVTLAMGRAGVAVKSHSPNSLLIVASDYNGSDKDGECVQLDGLLQTRSSRGLRVQSYGCHYLQHFITGIRFGGSVSEAYSKALTGLLEFFEAHQSEL